MHVLCSGDVDSVVPVTATRYSLGQLKLQVKIPWYPWYVKKQVSNSSPLCIPSHMFSFHWKSESKSLIHTLKVPPRWGAGAWLDVTNLYLNCAEFGLVRF